MSHKKSNYFPLKLNLSEVGLEPLEFTTNKTHGELDGVLKDLIEDQDYQISLSVQKLGNAYLAKGVFETKLPLVCSDCGGDYLHPLKAQFEELLVIQDAYKKGDQAAKNNHSHEWESDQPQCTYLETNILDLGELFHEQMALLEPAHPHGSADPSHKCEDVSQVQRDWLTIGESAQLDKETANPFKVLEGLKLKG